MDIQLLIRLFSDAVLIRALVFAVVTTCLLTGCAGSGFTATPYQAAESAHDVGYSSHRLSEGKFKILYKANSATSAETMKQYSQKRAKEIGLERDYNWYRIVSSEAVTMPSMTDQQVITAAPQSQTVDGAVTGDVTATVEGHVRAELGAGVRIASAGAIELIIADGGQVDSADGAFAIVIEPGLVPDDPIIPEDPVSVLAAAENHVDLHLVTVLQEPPGSLDLELNVVLTRLRSQTNLLDLDAVLPAPFGFSLLQLVLEFPVVHDPADRRAIVRTDLNKIKAGILGYLQPLLRGEDPDHVAFRINYADGSDPDLIVDPVHLFRRCRW